MKKAVIVLSLLFFTAQFPNAQQTPFLRLYNSSGKKISKGHLFDTTDISLILSKGTKGKKYVEIPVTKIDLIKTKRSTANRVLITTLKVIGVGVVVVAVLYSTRQNGLHGRKYSNKNEMHEILKPKPLKRYEINNDLETWKEQRIFLNRLL